jgi:hypothetical protein
MSETAKAGTPTAGEQADDTVAGDTATDPTSGAPTESARTRIMRNLLGPPADGWWDPRFSQAVQMVWLWMATRLALIAFVIVTNWTAEWDRPKWEKNALIWVGDRLSAWDGGHYLQIAREGYPEGACCPQAFMPGYPMAIRYVAEFTGLDQVTAGWLISLVCGTAAALLLWHLAMERGGTTDLGLGRRTVVLFAVAPYGIYLVSVYTESLFLVLAIGAWLAGVRKHWWIAGILTAGAVLVRINGLFLLAALVVMYLGQMRGDGRRLPRLNSLALLLPVVAEGAVAVYFHSSTGSWNAWQEAQTKGWGRKGAAPWDGLHKGWLEMTGPLPAGWTFAGVGSLVTVLVGLGFVVAFALLRRWPETVYMVLNVTVLVSSTTMLSAARYGLIWFPAFILVAELTGRRRFSWLQPALVIACLPLMAVVALRFSQGAWVA